MKLIIVGEGEFTDQLEYDDDWDRDICKRCTDREARLNLLAIGVKWHVVLQFDETNESDYNPRLKNRHDKLVPENVGADFVVELADLLRAAIQRERDEVKAN